MKRLLWVLAILLLSVWVGLQLNTDPGYLLIAFKHHTIEMPLWFAFVIAIIVFYAVYMLLGVLNKSSFLYRRFHFWAAKQRARRAERLTTRGLIALAEGHWKVAEKTLVKAAKNITSPVINYLSAATAAQELGAYERRDDYLRMAHHATPQAEIAVGMVQAKLQLHHQQLEQSLATLQRLHELAPKNDYVLKLMQQLYLKLQDWKSLVALYPQLCKRKILSPEETIFLGQKIYCGLLQSMLEKGEEVAALEKIWYHVPRNLQEDPTLLQIYIECLIAKNCHEQAEKILRTTLKKSWYPELVKLYGIIKGLQPIKQLDVAEQWLKLHPSDAALLLTLGRLSLRCQLWGKARHYLELSIQISPTTDAYRELAALLEKLGEIRLAENCYKKGLLLATH